MNCSTTTRDGVAPAGVESVSLRRAMLDQVLAAARAAMSRECCGLLVGRGACVTRAIPIENVAESDHRFELHAWQQVRAEQAAHLAGDDILGVYHSHPVGRTAPSAADREGILWPDLPPYLHLIVAPDGRWALYNSRDGLWNPVSPAIT